MHIMGMRTIYSRWEHQGVKKFHYLGDWIYPNTKYVIHKINLQLWTGLMRMIAIAKTNQHDCNCKYLSGWKEFVKYKLRLRSPRHESYRMASSSMRLKYCCNVFPDHAGNGSSKTAFWKLSGYWIACRHTHAHIERGSEGRRRRDTDLFS
jgi:hypothetical protein